MSHLLSILSTPCLRAKDGVREYLVLQLRVVNEGRWWGDIILIFFIYSTPMNGFLLFEDLKFTLLILVIDHFVKFVQNIVFWKTVIDFFFFFFTSPFILWTNMQGLL